MASLNITIKTKTDHSEKFLVELDFNKFEKLASSLGLFSEDFLKSLDRAEKDYKEGKVQKLRSLRSLRLDL